MPQDHLLFSRTVKENILYGKQDATDEEVNQAIAEAHFEKDLHMLPSGLETMVGEKGVALSGGQNKEFRLREHLWRIRRF